MSRLCLLNGSVKYYDWGGTSFIPSLLDEKNETHRPHAEYWLGVHPQANCTITLPHAQSVPLPDYIAKQPEVLLGEKVVHEFSQLPYLLKALDVRDMLSIQVHPSKEDAIKEFELENQKGIALNDPARNYKDANHKPELMVAIGDFWLLHGFRQVDDMNNILSTIPELNFLSPIFADNNYKALYAHVMQLPQVEVNDRLQPLLDRIIPLYKNDELDRSSPHYWAAKGSLTFSQPGKLDRGIFSVYLFNLLHLKNGQAIFQAAGIPHAYLFGRNVEIMASSDNVLRGGLTTKHIDVTELLKHTRCEATRYTILDGVKRDDAIVFHTPAPDFELSMYQLEKGHHASLQASTGEMFLLIDGKVHIQHGDEQVQLEKGHPSAIAFAGAELNIKASENSWLFKAGVPQLQ